MEKRGVTDFDGLTTAETIVREHRELLRKRPELGKDSIERSRNEHDLFTLVNETFPGTAQV